MAGREAAGREAAGRVTAAGGRGMACKESSASEPSTFHKRFSRVQGAEGEGVHRGARSLLLASRQHSIRGSQHAFVSASFVRINHSARVRMGEGPGEGRRGGVGRSVGRALTRTDAVSN